MANLFFDAEKILTPKFDLELPARSEFAINEFKISPPPEFLLAADKQKKENYLSTKIRIIVAYLCNRRVDVGTIIKCRGIIEVVIDANFAH